MYSDKKPHIPAIKIAAALIIASYMYADRTVIQIKTEQHVLRPVFRKDFINLHSPV
jgi:hypothetical protein